jgi:hypothetical protein
VDAAPAGAVETFEEGIEEEEEAALAEAGVVSQAELKELEYQANPTEHYRSTRLPYVPKTSKLKAKFFKMFEDYSTGCLTLRQVGERYGCSLNYAGSAIKWAAFEMNKADKEVWFQGTIDRLTNTMRELRGELDKAKGTRERLWVWAEIRRTQAMLAKMQGLMAMYDQNRDTTVNVVFGNFKATGAGPRTVEGTVERT